MVHSLSEIWSAAATPPLWLSSRLTVGKEHPLVRPAQPKTKAPPLAAHSKWHRPISKMTHDPTLTSQGRPRVAPLQSFFIRSGEPQNHGNFVVIHHQDTKTQRLPRC